MSTRFLERYEKLIEFYKVNLPEESYCEKHHIIPQCLGGTNDIENLILLPARAHFIAHYFLHKAYPENNKLAHAFAMMCVNNPHQNRKTNSKIYEAAKIARSKALKGSTRPQWVKEKLRKPKKSKENYKGPKSEQHKLNISLGQKGKPKKKESVEKTTKSMRPFYDKKIEEANKRKSEIKQKFYFENISRKEFCLKYNISLSTLKRALTSP